MGERIPDPRHLGAGDRWLHGQEVPGVTLAHRERVEIMGGSRDGQRGVIALLLGLDPEPLYLMTLEFGGELRIRQSSLRSIDRD